MNKCSLSQRERTVIELVAQGHTDKEIAQHLGLSINTVIGYVRSARQKFGAPNRTAAVMQYYRCVGSMRQSEIGNRHMPHNTELIEPEDASDDIGSSGGIHGTSSQPDQ